MFILGNCIKNQY